MLWHLCFGGAFGFVAVESMFTIKCFFSSLGTGGTGVSVKITILSLAAQSRGG